MEPAYEQIQIDPQDEFRTHYIRLRTVLDGLEATALRYCLKDGNPNERMRRIHELEDRLMPVVQEIAKLQGPEPSPEGGCGDGYVWCNGVCVPYQCPNLNE